MPVRLLVAVLMLTGPMPVRVCTCAAAAHPAVPAEQPLPQPSPEAKSRGCGHRAKANAESAFTSDKTQTHSHVQPDAATGHSHPDRHDRDCPAVNPRPVVTAAVPTPAPDAPIDHAVSLAARVEPLLGGHRHVRLPLESQTAPSAVPLYLSLCTLRN